MKYLLILLCLGFLTVSMYAQESIELRERPDRDDLIDDWIRERKNKPKHLNISYQTSISQYLLGTTR
jgi:hypothetical protein